MTPGHLSDNFAGLKNCIYANLTHSFGDDDEACDHPSPIIFLYDIDTKCVLLYCPVCQLAWFTATDFQSQTNQIQKSEFKDFSLCIPATIAQILESGMGHLIHQSSA